MAEYRNKKKEEKITSITQMMNVKKNTHIKDEEKKRTRECIIYYSFRMT